MVPVVNIFSSFIALVLILGLLLRLRAKPPKKPEQIIKPEPKLIPIEQPISPTQRKESVSPIQDESIQPIQPNPEEDEFENLKEYIKIRLDEGVDKEHVKQTLIIKGWPEEVLDVALDGSKEIENKLEEIESYIKSSSEEGYTLESIRGSILEQGWSESITDLLLFECHKPHKNLEKLKGYVNYKLAQGRKKEEIKQVLKSMGWKEEVILSVL